MENSKKFVKEAGVAVFISFKDGKTHTVKLLKDKIDEMPDMKDPTKKVKGMKYLVEEAGEHKSFFTSSIALIQKLSEFNPGDEVSIKLTSQKGPDGFKSTFKVARAGEEMVDTTTGEPEEEPLPEEEAEIGW